MLIVSKDRYLPVAVNTIVLQAQEKYFYIHRDVYDQAVILADRYPSLEELASLVGGSGNEETVQWFYSEAPKPLHILAPYLQLIDGDIERDMELCCGVLHVITSLIHVRHFIQKPPEVRRSVSFSLSIREEYEMAWESFFLTALPYEKRGLIYGTVADVPHAASISESTDDKRQSSLAEQEGNHHVFGGEHAVRREPDPVMTTFLEGFSQKREEAVPEPKATSQSATAAERKATRMLLS